jgi:hypothetical protein
MKILLCLLVMALSATTFAQDKIERAVTVDSLDIAPVWAGHPVGFALLTHAPFQFVAFYDDKRQLTVAQRKLDERQWAFSKLPVTTGWDSHNYITMVVDDDGFLHLSGDMHVVPLKYFRTTKPLDASTFKRIEKMVGSEEQRTTYPKFLRGPKNELLFTYRDGSSGNGNQIFNIYDLKTKTWQRLLDKPLTDGQGERNAYFEGPIKGPDGYFHLAWVWRESPDAATNHDLSYARSKDLLRWEKGNGQPLVLPIRLQDCDIVDAVPVGGGMINGNSKIGFDDKGRVTISYHKHDAQGHTQPWTARLENGEWKLYQTTDWPWRWEFGGGGTLNFGIGLGPVVHEVDGRLTQSFRHVQFGSGIWLLDPQTLRAQGKIQRQNTPPELGKIEGTFEGLKVKTAGDAGVSDKPGIRYILRWETLESNRDRPREGTLPAPSMLRLYAIKTEMAS